MGALGVVEAVTPGFGLCTQTERYGSRDTIAGEEAELAEGEGIRGGSEGGMGMGAAIGRVKGGRKRRGRT